MDKMPSVTRLLDLAKTFDKSAHQYEARARKLRDAAELMRDHASDEAHAARMVAALELVVTAMAENRDE